MSPKRLRTLLATIAPLAGMVGSSPAPTLAQDYQLLHTFDSLPGRPNAPLVQGSDGALYGTAYFGGASGRGIVFKVNPDGSGYTKLHDFDGPGGANPTAGLVIGPDGYLYGVTESGGGNWGTIFKIREDGSGFLKLYDFDLFANGGIPGTGLLDGGDGFLYGTARSGGPSFNGVVFRITTDGAYTKLHDFDGTDGGHPLGELIVGSDDALYGTCFYGGSPSGASPGDGVVYRIGRDGSGFSVLHRFAPPEGANPRGALTLGADGLLYGTAAHGGPSSYGSVFRVRETGADFQKLHDFDLANGADPAGGLVADSDGAFYGTAVVGGSWSGGVAFRITPAGDFTKLYDFDGTNGTSPLGLAATSGGDLFGVTIYGGPLGNGVVFRMSLAGSVTRILDLGVTDGGQPLAGLIHGDDGALYGTASNGGRWNSGVVFKVREDGSGFEVLHDFDGTGGANPSSPLAKGSDGAFYGVTRAGGTSGLGTVFKLNEDGTAFAKLHDFDGSDGAQPLGALLLGSDDALYGLTSMGGASNQGVVFRLSESGAFTKLGDLGGVNGALPAYAGLVEAGDGLLYGTASSGGTVGYGTVFRIGKDGSGLATVHDFVDYLGGAAPLAGLLVGSDGALYGTTAQGGAQSAGTAFKVQPDGSGFRLLHEFNYYTDGGYPYAALTRGSDGMLYGTTSTGGSGGGAGGVFKLSEDGSSFARLFFFDLANGGNPWGHVIEGQDGALYGTAPWGGPGSAGVVFRLVPAPDSDEDGAPDPSDNCPSVYNPDQRDSDFDGLGDACDPDADNDGILDVTDNCPNAYNPDQANRYGGPAGDLCEDSDADSVLDAFDNCPLVPNRPQTDGDSDGVGDACDLPNLSISDVSINEEDSGLVNAGFVVSLYPPSSNPVSVDIRTTAGTASPGVDFLPLALTMTFKPGQTARSLTVKLVGDLADEEDESYFVDLSSPVGAALSRASGIGTILDDDGLPQVRVDSPSVTEGPKDRRLTFSVTLSTASGKTVRVAYETADGTATAPADYLPASGELVFEPGQRSGAVSVVIRADGVREDDEHFFLNLLSSSNATIAVAQGKGSIRRGGP